jgi:5'-nucleotidase
MTSILLTNDDGYFSPALQCLRARLLPEFAVTVVAPDQERSAVSMALTLNRPLRVKTVEPGVFAVDGTPSDCVNLAMQALLPSPPDLIVSGMNLGENLAEDIFFSGTVGGAFSGFLYGVPALALSLIGERSNGGPYKFAIESGADMAIMLIRRLLAYAQKPQVYNANIPFHCNGRVRVTDLGLKRYTPDIISRVDPRGQPYYWIGTGKPTYDGAAGSDIEAIMQGYVSLSVINYDLKAPVETDRLRGFLTDLE